MLDHQETDCEVGIHMLKKCGLVVRVDSPLPQTSRFLGLTFSLNSNCADGSDWWRKIATHVGGES